MTTDVITGSPDLHAAGLTGGPVDALRYDGNTDDPTEVAGLLRMLMPGGVSVLDVGVGTGSVNVVVNRGRNNRVVALEPDPARAAVAAGRGIEVRGGMLDEAFLAGSERFDVVMASDVIEHVASPAEFLDLLKRAARPGGLILISTPNVAHWSVRLDLLLGRFDYSDVGIMDATHLRWFTERTIRSLFDQAGLEITALRHTAGYSLPVYHRGLVSRVPGRWRAAAVVRLARYLPRLFGMQHVVAAHTPG